MCLVGVVVRRYIDFLILLIPTPLVPAPFLQQHPYFLFFFLNVFHSLYTSIIPYNGILFELSNNIFLSIIILFLWYRPLSRKIVPPT